MHKISISTEARNPPIRYVIANLDKGVIFRHDSNRTGSIDYWIRTVDGVVSLTRGDTISAQTLRNSMVTVPFEDVFQDGTEIILIVSNKA